MGVMRIYDRGSSCDDFNQWSGILPYRSVAHMLDKMSGGISACSILMCHQPFTMRPLTLRWRAYRKTWSGVHVAAASGVR
jgi:hypothetical protein